MKHILHALFCLIYVVLDVQGKAVLITGGAGFIGATLTERLLAEKDTVIIVDSFVSLAGESAATYNALKRERIAKLQKENPDLLSVYECSITDLAMLDAIFAKHSIDAVCHLAAHAGVRASIEHPQLFIENNITGTVNVLEMVKKYNIFHCVLASSSSVYGNTDQVPFTEDQATDTQTSVYGATKKSLELLAQVYSRMYGFSATCLRFFTVYGPYGRFDMAPFIFMDTISKEQPITIYGDGTVIRDFTYVDDIVNGIVKAIEKPVGFQIINLGTTNTITLNNFIALIEDVVGKKAQRIYKDFVAADVRITKADITKASLLLDYLPNTTLPDGLRKMYQWYTRYFLN